MTARTFPMRCLDDDCGWRGDRRTVHRSPCPWCGGEVEIIDVQRRVTDGNDERDYGIVRPTLERSPFGIPRRALPLQPKRGELRVLPNGLRARVVHLPTMAEAMEHAQMNRSGFLAEVASYTLFAEKIS